MTIALQGIPSLYQNASADSVVVPYPAGIVSGEVLIMTVANSTGHVNITPPAGWTYGGHIHGPSTVSQVLFYRIADATETGSVTHDVDDLSTTLGRVTGTMSRWAGVDTTTPVDVAFVSDKITSSVNFTAPTISTVTDNAMLLHCISLNAAGSSSIQDSAGTTNVTGSTGAGGGRGFRLNYEARPTAGATGTRLWTQSGSTLLQWSGITFALRPSGVTPNGSLSRCTNGVPETTTMSMTIATSGTTTARIKAGTDAALTTGVVYGSSVAVDVNGEAQLSISGLQSNTQYYYRILLTNADSVEVADDFAQVGMFKTGSTSQLNFSFAFTSCANTADPLVFANIKTKAPDLFLHLGDEYYADGSGDTEANFLAKMLAKRTSARAADLYRTVGFSIVPSDHDAMANDTNASSNPTGWSLYNTTYRRLTSTVGLPAGTGFYKKFSRGRVKFITIDTHSFASDPAATDDAAKTRLGATQKAWFKNEITNATEKVIVVVNADPWVGAAIAGNVGWYGFTTERTELADFFVASGKNIVMLGGDMHAVAADDGTNAPGGITVFQASPAYNTSSQKGGPYTVGPLPAAGIAGTQQYGWVDVTDTGTDISLAFTAYDSTDTSLLTLTKSFSVGSALSLPLSVGNYSADDLEFQFYSQQSGLSSGTLNDHKYYYLKNLLGIEGTLNDLEYAYYVSLSGLPATGYSLDDHKKAAYEASTVGDNNDDRRKFFAKYF